LKALTDDSGRRAGHFIDEAGKTYRGFSDESDKRIEHIADEAGAMFDAASGWASDTWAQVKETAGSIGARASSAAGALAEQSASAGTTIQEQSSKLNGALLAHFRDQPLVGGALAFAIGAAVGAPLPPTETEDVFLGEVSDTAKDTVSEQASTMIGQGKDIASEVYGKAVAAVSSAHDAAKDRVLDEVDAFKTGANSQEQTS
jgi:ElaB/YqjD/DUF883 family membrane-anchored ribosome-binding protein